VRLLPPNADYTITATATRLGWIRRPDLDGDSADVWEAPYGAYIGVAKGTEPTLTLVSYLPKESDQTPRKPT
jgi:hypothetical protein